MSKDRIVLYRGEEVLRVENDKMVVAPEMTAERMAAILLEINDAFEDLQERGRFPVFQ